MCHNVSVAEALKITDICVYILRNCCFFDVLTVRGDEKSYKNLQRQVFMNYTLKYVTYYTQPSPVRPVSVQ